MKDILTLTMEDINSNHYFVNIKKFDKIIFGNIEIDNNIIYINNKDINVVYDKKINQKIEYIYMFCSEQLSNNLDKNFCIKVLSKVWNKYHNINIRHIDEAKNDNGKNNDPISSYARIIISNLQNKSLSFTLIYPYESLIPIMDIIEIDKLSKIEEKTRFKRQ